MVRRIPIRAKVAGALALPLVGLGAAAGIGVSASTAESRDVTRQTELAIASIGHAGLVSALQHERNLAVFPMLGFTDAIEPGVGDTATARARTDEASGVLRREIAEHGDAWREDFATALQTLAGLPGLRQQVDLAVASPGPANRELAHDVFTSYSTMVSPVFSAHERLGLALDDPVLRQGGDLVDQSSRAADAVAQLTERLVYIGTGPSGIDEPTEAAQIAELRRDVVQAHAAIAVKGTGDYTRAAERLLADPRVTGFPELAGLAIAQGGPVEPAALVAATPLGPPGTYVAFRDDAVEVLEGRAESLRDRTDARRRLYLVGAFGVVVAAVLIAWRVSRSISRPLRHLSVEARAMATHRLPVAVRDILGAPPGEDVSVPDVDPIKVRARDEVADVARAFNDVQEAAIGLAVEQAALRRNIAESYVNLGRRNQNLLSRLLAVVDDLEQGETDADRLGQLYKLDHLATRIRRNAESLLVLSQAGEPTTWKPPVALADVVRAALGEIEGYERVLVRTLDPTMVAGGASPDLAHLLAELIENGLRHSPPRELVEVSGRATAGGYEVSIVDHGLGMTPDDLARANERLAGHESFTVTPAKYLGHYVTAVLAARHGIKVRLQGSVVVGIAALVDLPASLIADGGADGRGAVTAVSSPDRGARGANPSTDTAGVPAPVTPAATAVDDSYRAPPPHAGGRRGTVVPARSAGVEPDADGGDSPSPAAAGALLAARLPAPSSGAPAAGRAERPPDAGSPVAARSGPPAAISASTVDVTVGDGPEHDADRGRTASGLVRRVRGAHVPRGAAAGRAGAPNGGAAPAPRDEPSSTPVDGAEIRRFLTSLVGGVQRSLDEQSSATTAGHEG